MAKSITILTQYYPPETGAPQNRLHSLAKFLVRNGYTVRVVTALPNYPTNRIFDSYRGKRFVRESIDHVEVFRTWIFVSDSRSVFARLLNYFSFTISSAFFLLRRDATDLILCESPPLFLGITAVLVRKIKKSKLIFNVSDLWPASAEKLNIVKNQMLLRWAYKLEAWIYRNADLISGQTQGIVNDIRRRFPEKHIVWFPNGVDFDFFETSNTEFRWRDLLGLSPSDFVLCYAGIIGHAQGLEIIVGAAEKLKGLSEIKFIIAGEGPEKIQLMERTRQAGLTNVFFVDHIEKKKIPSLIASCDAFIIPLRKLDIFMGAIPSKLFEPLAMKKPLLLGVDGEARELFINQGAAGIYFEPENVSSLVEGIVTMKSDAMTRQSYGDAGYKFAKENFDREKIHAGILTQLQQIG